jgi:hypothetical protein
MQGFNRITSLALLLVAAFTAGFSAMARAQVTSPEPGLWAFASDNGNWGGAGMGTSHQAEETYWIEKRFDVPAALLAKTRVARLRVYMAVYDYSIYGATDKKQNGLDESFELVVNGQSQKYQDDDPRLPSIPVGTHNLEWHWHDFLVPVEHLKAGSNTFLIRKLPIGKDHNDDFIYIGIDPTVSNGNSRMSVDGGKTWEARSLNKIDAHGEYMIRLLLSERETKAVAHWTPRGSDDSQKLLAYVAAKATAPQFEAELDTSRIDSNQSFTATLSYAGTTAPQVQWLDDARKPFVISGEASDGKIAFSFPATRRLPVSVEVSGAAVTAFDVAYVAAPAMPEEDRVDMAPRLAAAKGKPSQRPPAARRTADGFILENSLLQARFSTKPKLQLVSLRHELLQKDILSQPALTRLFLIENDGRRFGADDWQVRAVRPLAAPQKGFAVELALPQYNLSAELTAAIDHGFKGSSPNIAGLRFGLQITNVGETEQTWKTAFPHLAGLQLSSRLEDDYYLFPYHGGLIGNLSAHLHTNYGDESAWWQMIDLYSTTGGAGISLRVDDKTGLYKSPALLKSNGIGVRAGIPYTVRKEVLDPAMMWQQSLALEKGTAMTWEYLRRTRAPQTSFSPPDAVIEMHDGDWKTPMQEYSRWAHHAWQWRPWPSKLHDVWNIVAPGWGQTPLFKDGKYRTDYINDKAEISELMSWWEWSEKGPWRVPMDRLAEGLGEEFFKEYASYWVQDPATGKLKYPLNRGDYVGSYNTAWGGLPALREHIEAIRRGGQLATLYTDPILADDNTELGHEYGPTYGVMNPFWKPHGYASEKKTPGGYVGNYGSYNMCPDNAWYQDFLVGQMTQIIKDTGADGIRLDEYGNPGYTCFNPQHKHIFAEPRHNAWLQAVGLACEKIRAGLDKIRPDILLMSEHSGHDYMAKALDGAIDYESSLYTLPVLRPVPLTVFRFYFPEHKLYDLDYKNTPHGAEWRFWNAVGSFEPIHPPRYHRILKENGDAFGIVNPEALIPTLIPRIYANRFSTQNKQITLLYSDRRFTVDAPLLKVSSDANQHFFDLLNGRELIPQNGAIRMKLRPDAVACIARLPRVLEIAPQGADRRVTVSGDLKNALLILCAADGTPIKELKATPTVTFSLEPQMPEGKGADGKAYAVKLQPTYVKLLRGKYLLDAVQLAK